MTIVKVPQNTELRTMPFGRKAGYASYRAAMDQAGRTQNLGIFGDAQVAQRNHHVSLNFNYGYFLDSLEVEVDGSGTITEEGALLVATVTNLADHASAHSKAAILYQSGFDAQCMFTAAFTKILPEWGITADQHIGPHDGDDGFVVACESDELAIERYKGGVLVEDVEQEDFNLDTLDGEGVSGFTIDIEKLNIYRIQWGYLGIAPAIFEVYGGALHGWIPFHIIDLTNQIVDTHINNAYLPVSIHIEILSGTPPVPLTLKTASWYGGTLGGDRGHHDLTHFGAQNTISLPATGVPQQLIALRNKTLFRGATNRLRADILYFSFSADGNKSVSFDMYVDATLTGAIWNDVEANESIMELAVNPYTRANGRYIGSVKLNKVGSQIVEFPLSSIHLEHDDLFCIEAQSASGSSVAVAVRWGEAR